MALEINTENNKDNKTIIELAHQTIPDKLIVGLGKDPYKELADMIDKKIPINGFVGGVVVAKEKLDEEVPSNFDNSTKVKTEEETYTEDVITYDEDGKEIITPTDKTRMIPVLDNNDEPVMVPKTWREYTIIHEHEDDACILVGYRNGNGNRASEVPNKELIDYIDYFTIDVLLHRDDYLDYIKVQGDEI